jgi:hypothetical protein
MSGQDPESAIRARARRCEGMALVVHFPQNVDRPVTRGTLPAVARGTRGGEGVDHGVEEVFLTRLEGLAHRAV